MVKKDGGATSAVHGTAKFGARSTTVTAATVHRITDLRASASQTASEAPALWLRPLDALKLLHPLDALGALHTLQLLDALDAIHPLSPLRSVDPPRTLGTFHAFGSLWPFGPLRLLDAFLFWPCTIPRLVLTQLTERPRCGDEQGERDREGQHLRHMLICHLNPPVCGQLRRYSVNRDTRGARDALFPGAAAS